MDPKPIIGSFDHKLPAEQMERIDTVLKAYFDTDNWLDKRNKIFPQYRRTIDARKS